MAYLSTQQAGIVTAAVTAAEEHTSGEIVTVLADRSAGYSDIALAWAAIASFTAMSVLAVWPAFFLGKIDWLMGGWGHDWTNGEIISLTVGFGLIKFLGVWLIQLWQPLKFLLIPGPVKTARVHARAIAHFKVGAERRTHGRTGIMIYLSMHEHRAEIVADEPIAVKVPAEVWGEAMTDMLVEIKQGRIAEGMAAGIRDVGVVLTEHFPRAQHDVNELPNRLIEV
jgi:putative membrane protein